MASSVSSIAKVYEASQVVSLNGLRALIENKKLKTFPDFSSPADPNPVKFSLVLEFGICKLFLSPMIIKFDPKISACTTFNVTYHEVKVYQKKPVY